MFFSLITRHCSLYQLLFQFVADIEGFERSVRILVDTDDRLLRVDGVDYTSQSFAVGMTAGVEIHHVVEHITELFVTRIDGDLLGVLIIAIP